MRPSRMMGVSPRNPTTGNDRLGNVDDELEGLGLETEGRGRIEMEGI